MIQEPIYDDISNYIEEIQKKIDSEIKDLSSEDSLKFIENIIKTYPIVVFIKGTKYFPHCGFSSRIISILNSIEKPFIYVNVLDNENIRSEIKKFSDWPTIPQLYIHKEFIGGLDITLQAYKKGILQEKVSGNWK